MLPLERLRQAVDCQQALLRASVPGDRQAAIIALLGARDRISESAAPAPAPDLITGRRIDDLGGNKALQLCLESADESPTAGALADDLDGWSAHILDACGQLAEAELVLSHCEAGFMQLVADSHGSFDAWIATKRVPTSWRERADVDWWATWLRRQHAPELQALRSEQLTQIPSDAVWAANYDRQSALLLTTMAFQLSYPPETVMGGCTVQLYRDVLGRLVSRALWASDDGALPAPQSERALVAAVASELGADSATVGSAVSAFTLDRENAAYHGAVPGVASAPLVRVGPDQLVFSLRGLTTQPLFFLTRELRRRAAQEYHNTAFQRESVFRQDVYALFQDKRFVTSASRIELRREAGDLRTDIDAVVFDRKSGTLGLFELKTQDPFARSHAELSRQRDNVLYANRQVSGILAWTQRHGADALLGRIDARAAKTFRVQKVYPFVLGRYLAQFSDGPEPDQRAAWGTWPQLLRLLDTQPLRASDANPIASLFARLMKAEPQAPLPADAPAREITVGSLSVTVHPSYAAFRAQEQRRP